MAEYEVTWICDNGKSETTKFNNEDDAYNEYKCTMDTCFDGNPYNSGPCRVILKKNGRLLAMWDRYMSGLLQGNDFYAFY